MKTLLTALSVILASTVIADDGYWTGTGADNRWMRGDNWQGGKRPTTDGTAIFGSVTSGAHTNIDVTGVTALPSIKITGASAPAYQIGALSQCPDEGLAFNPGATVTVDDEVQLPQTLGFKWMGGGKSTLASEENVRFINDSGCPLKLAGGWGAMKTDDGQENLVLTFKGSGTGGFVLSGEVDDLPRVVIETAAPIVWKISLPYDDATDRYLPSLHTLPSLVVSAAGECELASGADLSVFTDQASAGWLAELAAFNASYRLFGEGLLHFSRTENSRTDAEGYCFEVNGADTVATIECDIRYAKEPKVAGIGVRGGGILKLTGRQLQLADAIAESQQGGAIYLFDGSGIRANQFGLQGCVADASNIGGSNIAFVVENGGLISHAGAGETCDRAVTAKGDDTTVILENVGTGTFTWTGALAATGDHTTLKLVAATSALVGAPSELAAITNFVFVGPKPASLRLTGSLAIGSIAAAGAHHYLSVPADAECVIDEYTATDEGILDFLLGDNAKVKLPLLGSEELQSVRVNGLGVLQDSEGYLTGNGTAWKTAVDGVWSDASKWTRGVPTRGATANLVLADETAYTVTMADEVAGVPGKILLGKGSTLKVTTNYPSWPFALELQENGTLLIAAQDTLDQESFGRLDFQGGLLKYDSPADTENSWGQGDLALTNVNVLIAGSTEVGIRSPEDESSTSNLYLVASGAGAVSTIAITNSARLYSSRHCLHIGDNQQGTSVLTLNSDGRGLGHSYTTGIRPQALFVGNFNGTGIVNLSDGLLEIGDIGILLGTVGKYWNESRLWQPTGIFNQTGGRVEIAGALGSPINYPSGLVIGDGSRPGQNPLTETHFTGEWNLSDGEVECKGSYVMIGLGHGTGTLNQRGGTLIHKEKFNDAYMPPMVIGWHGGTGTWNFLGKASQTDFGDAGELYIGGMNDSHLYQQLSLVVLPNAGAEGTLYIDEGAKFTAPAKVTLGDAGLGTLAIGPTGTFNGNNLVIASDSESILKFTASESGFGKIQLTGSLSGSDRSRIVVDFQNQGELSAKFVLLSATSIEGIDVSQVELVNVPSTLTPEVTVTSTEIAIGFRGGSMIIIR